MRDEASDQEPLCEPETPVLLPESLAVVEATCIKIEKKKYPQYGNVRLQFTFAVVPREFSTTHTGPEEPCTLYYFCSYYDRPSIHTDLYQLAVIANGGQLEKKQKVTRSMFLNKLFKLELRHAASRRTGQTYTVVSRIVEKVTG